MNLSGAPRKRSDAAVDIERIYDMYGGILTETLIGRYHVPRPEAAEMVRAALEAVITAEAEDPEAWVIAAACRSGQAYQLASKGTALPDASDAKSAALVRAVLATLPEPARRAAQLHYVDGRSYVQIAEELGVTPHYVKRLIFKAVSAVRKEQRRRQNHR
ncbi:MAG TPA: sigma-70 family RNA polymerase sigma factor [Thermoanaerobaculia bacterium]|nr:sigma-70 family RNA polymerase sigma factor [Thermoanaerobaculia bacterium]